jgi:PPK2 family polyphosphate:nucleotide phosphotransferase
MAMKDLSELVRRYRVTDGKKFRLKNIDPGETRKVKVKATAKKLLAAAVTRISDLQERLYAQDKWALLLIFQAMDAAGKDGTIKHVMSGVNPQGCHVTPFKAPSSNELDHDFLWRATLALPGRGMIGVFNRSYYEEVLIVRVHPKLLAGQKLPEPVISKNIWEQRFEDIRAYEQYLTRNGVVIRKFFLHVSKAEQKQRFLDRLEMKSKNWKFAVGDVAEREFFNDYMDAYEEAVQQTASKQAPWFVVPADNKWFTRLVVAAAIIETLESLDLQFPTVSAAQRTELAKIRDALLAEET